MSDSSEKPTRISSHPYRFGLNVSSERRKYNGAMNGIHRSEYMIGYFTGEIAEYDARGPQVDKQTEHERLYSLRLLRNTIASHHRKIAEHQEVLATLPAMQ